jgi:hypothetical protein
MKKVFRVYLFLVLSTVTFFSCKKKDAIQPSPQKIYLTKKTYSNIVENYYYDAQNRFSRMEYIEPAYTQTTTVTAYDGNNNPVEYVVRTSGSNNVSKYNATYDTQNRPLTIESRDSINPATYNLRSTLSFTYSGNKQIRTASYSGSPNTAVYEATYNSDGNFSESRFINFSGVLSTTTSWSGYDTKNSHEPLLPHIVRGGSLPSKNNQTVEVFTNAITGVVNNYRAAHVYNSDNYVIQTTYSGTPTPLVYNYTYEKR